MTLILKWVNKTIFKEIHKMYPQAFIQINHEFPETASIDLVLVPGDLVFTARLDVAENSEIMNEIEQLIQIQIQSKEGTEK